MSDWLTPTGSQSITGTDGLGATSSTDRTIGPLSSAVEMIFSMPVVYNGDPTYAAEIRDVLMNVPEVQDLASTLSNLAGKEDDPWHDSQFKQAFVTAFKAALPALNKLSIPTTSTADASRTIAPMSLGASTPDFDRDYIQQLAKGGTLSLLWSTKPGFFKDVFLNRAVDWIGLGYQIDTSKISLKDFFDGTQANPWRTDLPLLSNTPAGGVSLSADSFWSRFNLSFLVDYVTNVGALQPNQTFKIPQQDAAYVFYVYTGFAHKTP